MTNHRKMSHEEQDTTLLRRCGDVQRHVQRHPWYYGMGGMLLTAVVGWAVVKWMDTEWNKWQDIKRNYSSIETNTADIANNQAAFLTFSNSIVQRYHNQRDTNNAQNIRLEALEATNSDLKDWVRKLQLR